MKVEYRKPSLFLEFPLRSRITRTQLWLKLVYWIPTIAVLSALSTVLGETGISTSLAIAPVVLLWGGVVASLAIRRLHDIGWPGWAAILLVVPVVNVCVALVLLLAPGKTENNRRG